MILQKKLRTKEHILATGIKEIDENDCINISDFRKNHSYEYALINHYFGTVSAFIEALSERTNKNIVKTNAYSKRGTLRNRLAYDMIESFHQSESFEQMAKRYNVSKAAINLLYNNLKHEIG